MYFPYLRGQQNELQLLADLHYTGFNKGNVLPIIEPVNLSTISKYKKLASHNVPFVLVLNPSVGEFAGSKQGNRIEEELVNNALSTYQGYLVGILLTPNSKLADLKYYLNTYSNWPKVIIHKTDFLKNSPAIISQLEGDDTVKYQVFFNNTSEGYRNLFANSRKVLIRDGFTKYPSNKQYPEHPVSEYFCDNYSKYQQHGYMGFGDFLTVGEEYKKGGSSPMAVAIHLTYEQGQEVRIAHFLSDSNDTTANPAGKFREALIKVADFIETNGWQSQTKGLEDFMDLVNRGYHFPGLGVIKKISMKHHLELMKNLA